MPLNEFINQEFFALGIGQQKSQLKAELTEKKYVDIRYSGKKRGCYATKAEQK